jgi:hypothetical protein
MQLARLNMRYRLRHDGEHRVYCAADGVVDRQSPTSVRNMQETRLRSRLEHETREMLWTAIT